MWIITGDKMSTSIVQHNEWVNKLLSLYQHSLIGNKENRGLDSDFARQTYIETRLDTELLQAVMAGNYQIVFLTGNPGDGKTAFLEKVYDKLQELKAVETQKEPTGWELIYNNITYTACYDASESYQGKSADERLRILFAPFKGNSEPKIQHVILVAINDGKLHSFFHLPDIKQDFKWLSETVIAKAFQLSQSHQDDSIVVVNLKERTLIDLALEQNTESSLFDKLLLLFTQKQHWDVCDTCSSQSACPIFANARSLGFGERAKQSRTRLKTFFAISHLRRQRHNTMRDVRSALSFIITGNLNCQSVHESPTALHKKRYFNSIFSAKDDTLQEFTELDPSRIGLPQLDRQLNILFHQQKTDTIRNELLPSCNNVSYMTAEEWMVSIRRELFFEGVEDKFATHLQGINTAFDLLPYRYFKDFVKYLQGNHDELCKTICRGISQTEGIRDTGIGERKNHLLIRVKQSVKEGLTICKKLPADKFEVLIPSSKPQFIESLPDKIIFKHSQTGIQCVLTLDVFEILLRMAAGQLPSSNEQKAILDELHEFKSRLHRYQAKDLLLIESNGQVHHITQQNGKIIRRV